MSPKPLFALADCNNFYASCERLFQPALNNKPVIVLSNNDGCVVARSNEAKALGIGMGIPFFKARKLVQQHGVKVFSSNYALYGDMSRRVMSVLGSFCPDMEIYSIDEAFLQLNRMPQPPMELALKMRQRVHKWTGIPISIGIAPTKVLAKLANNIAKKQKTGQFLIRDAIDIRDQLRQLPVTDLWGIGKRSTARLAAINIHTIDHLRQADPDLIRRHLSIVGERIVHELNGISHLDLEEIQPNKQILCSKSFGHRITTLPPILEAVSNYAARAAEKLRTQGLATSHLRVFLQTGVHDANVYLNSLSHSFLIPTADTRHLLHAAKRLAQQLFVEGYRYQKVGVMLLDLIDRRLVQEDLFLPQEQKDKPKLMHAIDNINKRLGRDELFFAAQGVQRPWRMISDHRSPRYTTCWSELATVT